jgi:triacylglycerol lipase
VNIVLMHGLLATGGFLPSASEYFAGVADRLPGAFGARVLSPSVPLLGTPEDRAVAAADQIRLGLARGSLDPRRPLHLIAHSMGGFDARFLVSHDVGGLRTRVASVTCIGTPHLGCPLLTMFGCALRAGRLLMPFAICPAPFALLREPAVRIERMLQQDFAELDRGCPDVDGVRYFEVAGTGRPRVTPTSLSLLPTAAVLELLGEGRHDGVVSVRSACRERPPLALWAHDHAGLIGHDLDWPLARPPADHLARYEALVQQVAGAQA